MFASINNNYYYYSQSKVSLDLKLFFNYGIFTRNANVFDGKEEMNDGSWQREEETEEER